MEVSSHSVKCSSQSGDPENTCVMDSCSVVCIPQRRLCKGRCHRRHGALELPMSH